MTASTFPRSGNPRKPIPAAEAPGQIPEGVGFAAATAVPTPTSARRGRPS